VSASQLPTEHLGEPPRTGGATARGALLMGRYRLVRRLGRGAFGTVWSARDERLDREVAVKVLDREQVIHARFEREARAAARLQHPAIVTLYEAAVDDDGAYLVSELVRGRTLEGLLEQGKLSDREILEIGVALCEALSHAHAQGVIHRDVKPSNVLVPSHRGRAPGLGPGLGESAKLTDFGVAHVVGAAALTRTGDIVGTLAYMAPEQALDGESGPPADLYSLALILYEALSGVNPRVGASRRRDSASLPPLRRQRRDLPRRLAAGIDTALRARPEQRGSLLDLRATLLACLDQADDTPGIVAPGWRGKDEETWVRDVPGPEWTERRQGNAPTLQMTGSSARALRSGLTTVMSLAWFWRALNAAAAGLGAAWLVTALWTRPPFEPALVALVVALIALVVPLAGVLLSGVALGVVGLAGALPALVAKLAGHWWQRALLGAAALCGLVIAGRLTGHNLYWLPARIPPSDPRALLALAAWALAAVVAPLLRTRRFPLLDLMLAGAWSVGLVVAVGASGAHPLVGELPGALLAAVIMGWGPLLEVFEETRAMAGIHDDVA
jgi:serine/threonine protein kinase